MRRSQSAVCLGAVLFALALLGAMPVCAADLADRSDVLEAIRSARSTVTLSSYTLRSDSAAVSALIAARAHGARISIALTARGFGWAVDANRSVVKRLCPLSYTDGRGVLCPAGTRIHLTDFPIHMKAAIVDGTTVYVSDTNFSAGGVYLRLPAATRLTVERAILGQGGIWNGVLATTKGASLQLEATLLRTSIAHHVRSLEVESESFGRSVVSDALVQALRSHVAVAVTVSRRDAGESNNANRTLAQLQLMGARIYRVDADEKIAIAGPACFVGSVNASGGLSRQIDWGMIFTERDLCGSLAARLARNQSGH